MLTENKQMFFYSQEPPWKKKRCANGLLVASSPVLLLSYNLRLLSLSFILQASHPPRCLSLKKTLRVSPLSRI